MLAAAVLPLYLLAKQSVTPTRNVCLAAALDAASLTLAHFISVFAVNELRGAY